VKYVLRKDLLLRKANFKWISHLLDDNQKSERIRFSTEFLQFLKSKSKYQLANVYTGDEMWIITIIGDPQCEWMWMWMWMWMLQGQLVFDHLSERKK
jgi:hypothetical protein